MTMAEHTEKQAELKRREIIRFERKREYVEYVIGCLIDQLDHMDGDPDLEPSLGWYPIGMEPDLEVDLADSYDDREGDLAGCSGDLEQDPGYDDYPGHIFGGQGA